ncbi:hypothetical protein [Marisediminicola sp. LYQ134]|uniref:hypothetical protein n=1 Tax=unclassified Marisediminicola TaxID=2618316 RepID=UPI0039831B18
MNPFATTGLIVGVVLLVVAIARIVAIRRATGFNYTQRSPQIPMLLLGGAIGIIVASIGSWIYTS